MNILDIAVFLILIIGAYRGWKYGGFSSIISLIGSLLIFILAFYLKNPLSTILYENLPFQNFGGIFKGISSFNILLYEGLSYTLCIIILGIILRIILKLTGIIDKVINLTLVFALPSKILGLIFGALEFYIYLFVILFVMANIPATATMFKDSSLGAGILEKTPLLSHVTNDLYHSVSEVYDICVDYENNNDKSKGDYEALEVLMKYDIITPESVKKLSDKGKLKVDDIDSLIEKYEVKK